MLPSVGQPISYNMGLHRQTTPVIVIIGGMNSEDIGANLHAHSFHWEPIAQKNCDTPGNLNKVVQVCLYNVRNGYHHKLVS